ncbi:hypothetical protein E2C01_010264 [Portunus trituberculatus]|uniref:Uncharacterized protein n=1 Tax=Portunus trituberculatus TaxID=210409 RepID=A0A5B7D7Z6_PORTR|nr:hypothetical protein [Portunus trituberculatus]
MLISRQVRASRARWWQVTGQPMHATDSYRNHWHCNNNNNNHTTTNHNNNNYTTTTTNNNNNNTSSNNNLKNNHHYQQAPPTITTTITTLSHAPTIYHHSPAGGQIGDGEGHGRVFVHHTADIRIGGCGSTRGGRGGGEEGSGSGNILLLSFNKSPRSLHDDRPTGGGTHGTYTDTHTAIYFTCKHLINLLQSSF